MNQKKKWLIIAAVFVVSLGLGIGLMSLFQTPDEEGSDPFFYPDGSEKEIEMQKITINEQVYDIQYENNESTRALFALFPLETTMADLNHNEKYVYFDSILPTNEQAVGHIEAGDVMLYGDSCLVIFYQSFNTGFSYTKIGHIDGLKIDNADEISVYFGEQPQEEEPEVAEPATEAEEPTVDE